MLSKVQSIVQRAEAQGSWLLAARTALLQPGKAWNYWRRTGSRAWMKALFTNPDEYLNYAVELTDSRLLADLVSRLAAKFSKIDGTTVRGNQYTPGAILSAHATHLYAIVRKLQPDVVVETGVCNGLSSAIVLAALTSNCAGHLYSVDLPEFTGASGDDEQFWSGKGGAVVPRDERSGWIVPDKLRRRWTLLLGKSSELLPKLLQELQAIDLFVHDSEHSFQNQLFEFRAAFARLAPKGVIFASDINWSRAFNIFAKEVSAESRRFFVDYSLGLVVRN
jgi:hypothetical protein